MECSRCGSDNRQGAMFCLRCGESLEQDCPQCGKRLLAAANFCDECGHRLRTSSNIHTFHDPGERTESSGVDHSHPVSSIPQSLADKILTSRSALEGERKLVTVLFADVADFTSLSEKLDPEKIHEIMDGCFRLLIDEIYRYEGTINQYTGNGIMALFGAPVAHEDHAQRACHAALSLRNPIEQYGKRMRQDHGVDFTLRMGMNSGLVRVGSIGDDLHMEYTAVGDTTNLAARMEAMANPGSTLVSGNTYKLARDFFKFKPLGKLSVKGKEEALEAYELLETSDVETRIGAAAIRGLTKFVGREHELGRLLEAFEKVRSGSGRVIGLAGEAGIGKSRLVLELKGMLQGREFLYLEGQCFHYGSSTAYLPILDILRSYFNIKEGLQEHTAKGRMEKEIDALDERLRYLLPPLHELFSLTIDDKSYVKLNPKQKRERIFEAVRDLLVRESQRRSLVIVIEDLHWIDKTSEEFLAFLIGWLAHEHILLILLFRPNYAPLWENKSYCTRLGLDQLPVPARGELVGSILHGGEVSDELRHLIDSRAGGNPLFVEELIYALLENGYIQKGDRAFELSRKPWEIRVPDTLQGIIAARMDRLDENVKRVMQVASVIGRSFAFSILETIAGKEEGLKSCLLKLQELEFVYEKSHSPELEYEFKHALVHEVAYQSLLLGRRREIHGEVGKGIEALYPGRLEEFYEMLAYHYSRSEDTGKAYTYLKSSGIKSTLNFSLWEAFRFYREAIHALGTEPATQRNKREEIEIRLLSTSTMISLGFPEDSLQILQDGERLARESDSKSLTTFCSLIGLYYSVKGELSAGMKYGEDCFKTAEEARDIELMAPIAFDLCSNYAAGGGFGKVIELGPRVLALLEETGREFDCFDRGYNIYSALLGFCGFSRGYLGDFEEGRKLCEKGLGVARKINNLYSLGLVEMLYGYILSHQGEGKEALEHFLKSIQYLEKGHIFVLLGLAWSGLGWAYYFRGELEAARSYVEKGLKFHSETGVRYNSSVHYWFLALIHYELGELEKAQSYAAEALVLSRTNHEAYHEGLSMATVGRILAKGAPSQSKEAEVSILEGIRILEGLKTNYCAVGHLFLGEVYLERNESEKALKTLKEAERVFRETRVDYWLTRTQTVLKKLQAMRSLP